MWSLTLLRRSVSKSRTRGAIVLHPHSRRAYPKGTSQPQTRTLFESSKKPAASLFTEEEPKSPFTTLLFKNFPLHAKDNEITDFLSQFGEIKSCTIPRNTFFAKTLGLAHVTFESSVAEAALEAVASGNYEGFEKKIVAAHSNESQHQLRLLANILRDEGTSSQKDTDVTPEDANEDAGDFLPQENDGKASAHVWPDLPQLTIFESEEPNTVTKQFKFPLGTGTVTWPGPFEAPASPVDWEGDELLGGDGEEEEGEEGDLGSPLPSYSHPITGHDTTLLPQYVIGTPGNPADDEAQSALWKSLGYDEPAPEEYQFLSRYPAREAIVESKEVTSDKPPVIALGKFIGEQTSYWVEQDTALWQAYMLNVLVKRGAIQRNPDGPNLRRMAKGQEPIEESSQPQKEEDAFWTPYQKVEKIRQESLLESRKKELAARLVRKAKGEEVDHKKPWLSVQEPKEGEFAFEIFEELKQHHENGTLTEEKKEELEYKLMQAAEDYDFEETAVLPSFEELNEDENVSGDTYDYWDLRYTFVCPKRRLGIKIDHVLEEMAELWNEEKMYELFGGRPGLVYRRLVLNHQEALAFVDVNFPGYYTQAYYDHMLSTVLKPYLASYFGMSLVRIMEVSAAIDPADSRRVRVAFQFLRDGLSCQEILDDMESGEPEGTLDDDGKAEEKLWTDVMQDDEEDINGLSKPKKLLKDEEGDLLSLTSLSAELDDDGRPDPVANLPSFFTDIEAQYRIIDEPRAAFPATGDWQWKYGKDHENRIKQREDAEKEFDLSFATPDLEDLDSNPWVKKTTKE